MNKSRRSPEARNSRKKEIVALVKLVPRLLFIGLNKRNLLSHCLGVFEIQDQVFGGRSPFPGPLGSIGSVPRPSLLLVCWLSQVLIGVDLCRHAQVTFSLSVCVCLCPSYPFLSEHSHTGLGTYPTPV